MQPACDRDILDDLFADHLNVVFCGTRAGTASALRGAYYAGPGNRFWPTLYTIGLTPRLLRPEEFPELLRLRIGLTDLAKTTAGQDAAMTPGDFDLQRFWQSVRRHAPSIVAFTSKTAAAAALAGKVKGSLGFGRLLQTIEGVEVHVLPSTSGLATRHWNIGPWQALGARVQELSQQEPERHATA